jgi:hypothetical protein
VAAAIGQHGPVTGFHLPAKGLGPGFLRSQGPRLTANQDRFRAFYSGALSHLEGFKDKYRNMVFHVRKDYDEHQANSAMMHVNEFMAGISAKIGETAKPIRWKFR